MLCEISGDSEPGPGWPGEEEIVTNKRRKGHPRERPIQKPGRGSQMLLGGLVRGRQKTGLSTDRTEGTGEADRSYFRGMEGKMLVELIEEGICKKEREDGQPIRGHFAS